MPNAGDLTDRFGRQYIYLIPDPTSETRAYSSSGQVGTWRLRNDDTSTPSPDNPGGSTGDLSIPGTAGVNIEAGQLLYLTDLGQLELASAASIDTARVVGVAIEAAAAGAQVLYTRNQVIDFFYSSTLIDGSPGNLEPGQTYFLSTTPGNWTATPDTTTEGAVVMSCGIGVEIAKMSIEIQNATVI